MNVNDTLSADDAGVGQESSCQPDPFRVALRQLQTRQSYKWRAFGPDVLPSFIAEMDFGLPDAVRAALRRAIDQSDTGYAGLTRELAQAFAVFARQRFGWDLGSGEVTPITDVEVAIIEVLRCVARPGDGVVINTPVYPPFFFLIPEAGCRVVEVPLTHDATGYELDLDAVEDAFRRGARVWLLCNPHNPTGLVLSRAELEAALDLAERYGVTVIADEIHGPLVLPGRQHVPLLSLGEQAADRGIVLTSASKAFNIAGLKCGLIVTDGPRMRAVTDRLPIEATFRVGHLGMIASIAAFMDGGPWLDNLVEVLAANRRLLGELLADRVPQVGYVPPEATYLAWLDFRALELGDEPSVALLERGHVALASGLDFGRVGAGFARLVIGTPPDVLRELVDRIATACRQ